MLAVVGDRARAAQQLARFRRLASTGRVAKGAAPGHRDGWGIVHAEDGRVAHAGRSTLDASTDPAFDAAVARVAQAPGRGAVVAHLRKASLGAVALENTHPFVEDGLAFCHNGTVEGVAPPGENDSRALFGRVLEDVRKGQAVHEALARLSREVAARHTYTSLTLLVTDGAQVWGLRQVGNDPRRCAPEACAPDYYTLGYALLDDGTVVLAQEREGLAGWTPFADRSLVMVAADGAIRARRA